MRHIIRRILNESIKENVKLAIDRYGLIKAVKLYGGLRNIEKMIKEPLLSFDEKIDFIKEVVLKYDGLSMFSDLDKTIQVESPQGEIREITYLGLNRAVIDIWDTDTFNNKGEISINYENLNVKYIDEIIDSIINHSDIKL